jgi:hypothetical protein
MRRRFQRHGARCRKKEIGQEEDFLPDIKASRRMVPPLKAAGQR